MRVTYVREGDIVKVNLRGQHFHAEVEKGPHRTEFGKRVLTVRPLDRRPIPGTIVTPHQVEGHWRKSRQQKQEA